MHPVLTAHVAAIRAAERVSPDAAARLALPLFMRVGGPLPVRPSDRAVHESARRSLLRVRGRDVVAYEWGSGPETVLLMHGFFESSGVNVSLWAMALWGIPTAVVAFGLMAWRTVLLDRRINRWGK